MGKQRKNGNADLTNVGNIVDEACRVPDEEPTNQAPPLIVTPLTVAMPDEPVVRIPLCIIRHPAHRGGWKTLKYFRKTNGKPYYTFVHKDHGTIRSIIGVLDILDHMLSLQIIAEKLVGLDKQDTGSSHSTQETSAAGKYAEGKDAAVPLPEKIVAPVPEPEPVTEQHGPNFSIQNVSFQMVKTCSASIKKGEHYKAARGPKRKYESTSKRSAKGSVVKPDKTNEQDTSKSYAMRGFRPGKAFLSQDELDISGVSCQRLHEWYMDQTEGKESRNNKDIGLKYLDKHLTNGSGFAFLRYQDLFDLFKLDAIDVGLITCFSLHMIQEMKTKIGLVRPRVAILDPQIFVLRPETKEAIIENENALVEHLAGILDHDKDSKDFYVFSYNPTWHWILIVIVPKMGKVWYLDSANSVYRNYACIRSVIHRAFDLHVYHIGKSKAEELDHCFKFQCHQQPSGSQQCGFYVCHHLKQLINYEGQPEHFQLPGVNNIPQDALFDIRGRIANFLLSQVLHGNGEFYIPDLD